GSSVEQIEKHAPSKPAHRRPDLSSDYIVPGNSTEQAIADIWQEFLGVDNVGIHDNFFELGGHSLLATRLVERLRSQFPVELSSQSLFKNRLVRCLGVWLGRGPLK